MGGWSERILAGCSAVARERAAVAGLANVRFIARDAEELELDEGSFDAVLSRATLMFLPDVAGPLSASAVSSAPPVGSPHRCGRGRSRSWGSRPPSHLITEELALPPLPSGRPERSRSAIPPRLPNSWRRLGSGTLRSAPVSVVFESESPEQYTEFIRDVAPQLTALVGDQPASVQERVWGKVTDAYRRFQDDDGRVRTENEAIWFKGVK